MKILADHNIPCVADAFHDLGEVGLMPGRDIRREHLLDCQCLITRTVTRVDEALLAGTPVEFVGTATIGTDHIDLEYLRQNGIACSNAAGCNAEAAAEYVISGLFAMSQHGDFDPFALKAGIVGYGNVGSRLYQKLDALGIDCRVCDPPLQETGESARDFVDLDEVLDGCNFISLHVPLTRDGRYPTFHLLDRERLAQLVTGSVLVNAARGEVVDNAALLELLWERDDLSVFLDTWENEPLVNRALLRHVDLATPHIAGYSIEGRLRGTQMVLEAACRHFGLESGWHMTQLLPAARSIAIEAAGSGLESWRSLFRQHCDIRRDHDAFVAGADFDDDRFAQHFDGLRRVYPDRLEYERFTVGRRKGGLPDKVLRRLGFKITG
ncbi:MAG: 4-phosphoerythronate dehydrogenase [Gammaproteobacteria bacterium]|nr:4-phosphoerythronate dehydrogenase [Gammaproteobacteria bacterium]MDH3448982.1 4-phosphoerythronate dehydrogenase [Gammaproteobacteria bacterium]